MKYIVNKCDEQGNIITGYEEVLEGTKEECEIDYRNYHEYDGPVDIEEIEEETTRPPGLRGEEKIMKMKIKYAYNFEINKKICAVDKQYRDNAELISKKEEFQNTRCKNWHIVLNCKTGKLGIINFNTGTSNINFGIIIAASFYTKRKAEQHYDWVSKAIAGEIKLNQFIR